MNTQTDQQLLRDYAERRSEPAFAELVRRHLDLVYSTALRMNCDAHHAEDVAQGVFLALAQNARKLARHPVLSGWLHRTTQNLAANVVRTNVRRQAREQEAVAMNQLLAADADHIWKHIAPHLDIALGELSEPDRDAVLLRYFERKSAQEMAVVLGVSAEAAQKRVNRAVDRLREIFSKRGVAVGAGAFAVVVSANATQAAPSGLAAAITSATLAGTAVSTATTVAATTKIIAMTALQKTLIATTILAVTGTSLYQARQNAQLRQQVRALQQQLADATKPVPAPETQLAAQTIFNAPTAATIPNGQNKDANWNARLLALNGADWRTAFALGQQLAALPPDTGFAILQANWNSISNFEARQQLLKAFMFVNHERMPAVLELGVLDPNAEVQSWALDYLQEVALRDFTADFGAATNWLATRRNSSLESAFNDAAAQAVSALHGATGNPLDSELDLIKRSALFSKFPQSIKTSGLDRALADVIEGNNSKSANLALETSSHMPLGDEWFRTVALPLLSNPELRDAAASALASTKSEWALQPMLEALSQGVYAPNSATHISGQPNYYSLAGAVDQLGSPKAIPTLIALIDADKKPTSIYGIGYYGLNNLTGVPFNPAHDGAWWRQWWANNKQRFPADVQALEIPNLPPVNANAASNPGGQK